MSDNILSRLAYRPWALGLALALVLTGQAGAAVASPSGKLPDIALLPLFTKPRRPLIDFLNPHQQQSFEQGLHEDNPLIGIAQALILKPDLGACQSFTNGCHEGGIVMMPTNNVMQTLGAGLGMQMGGVRLEYAHGLHTGVNFIGIRSSIP